jgi:hypothetical protein
MAKPSDFYIGVMEIFSILLPGAVITWSGWFDYKRRVRSRAAAA